MRALLPWSLVLLSACSGRGQIVLGIATDLPARDLIDQVTLDVTRRGEVDPVISYKWELAGVPAQNFRLPGSFNLYGDPGAEPTFDVLVKGNLGGIEQVRRVSSLGIRSGEDLFIRLGLVRKCEDVGCPSSLTCIEGQCRPAAIDLRTLPPFRTALVEGIECDSGTQYLDTGTHAPMPVLAGGCEANELCGEGTCLVDPATLDGGDAHPFTGAAAELFATTRPPGDFFAVGPVDQPRYASTATRLADGRVLVAGGIDRPSLDASAQPLIGTLLYDPGTARFTRGPDLPQPLSAGHTATRLSDGRVVLVGVTASGLTAITYDPVAGAFSTAGAVGADRFFHTATLLPSGKVLVYGGVNGISPPWVPVGGPQLYDPATQTFAPTANGAVVQRALHAVAVAPDGRVHFFGGIAGTQVIADVEVYDPATGLFTGAPPMAQPRAMHTATVLSDGDVVLVGGSRTMGGGAIADAELYATAMGPMPAAPPLGAPAYGRLFASAVALPGDRVLLVGGTDQLLGNALLPSGGALLYDHATRAFVTLPDPKISRVKEFVETLATGEILIGGGTFAGAFVPDGGASFDMPPPGDMSLACDPLGAIGANGCGPNQRCAIQGTIGHGPRMQVTATACVVGGTQPEGQPCVMATPTLIDNCAPGLACLNEPQSGSLQCLRLCGGDAACASADMGGPAERCGLVLRGLEGAGVGVCLLKCDYAISASLCSDLGMSCRFALHGAAGGGLESAEVCMGDGTQSIGMPCDGKDPNTECGSQLFCDGAACRYECHNQLDCDDAFGGTCTALQPGSGPAPPPSVNGYCSGPPPMDLGTTD